jgi:hypothetical protein
MNKIMGALLALSLFVGVAAVSFALPPDNGKKAQKNGGDKADKNNTTGKDKSHPPPAKGKGK